MRYDISYNPVSEKGGSKNPRQKLLVEKIIPEELSFPDISCKFREDTSHPHAVYISCRVKTKFYAYSRVFYKICVVYSKILGCYVRHLGFFRGSMVLAKMLDLSLIFSLYI